MRRIITVTLLLVVGTTVLAACGSNSSSSSGGMSGMSGNNDSSGMEKNQPVVAGAPEIAVQAGALSFEPKKISLTAGQDVTLALTSTDIAHDFYVDGVGHVVHAAARKTAMGGLMIDKAGTYKFWCTVKGHKEGGMVGTITVKV